MGILSLGNCSFLDIMFHFMGNYRGVSRGFCHQVVFFRACPYSSYSLRSIWKTLFQWRRCLVPCVLYISRRLYRNIILIPSISETRSTKSFMPFGKRIPILCIGLDPTFNRHASVSTSSSTTVSYDTRYRMPNCSAGQPRLRRPYAVRTVGTSTFRQ